MRSKKVSFSVNSYNQAVEVIKICHKNKIFPIIYIKYFMINKMGAEWIKEFKSMLKTTFRRKKFSLYIDCKNNYGIFINLVEQKIDYLKVKAPYKTKLKLNEIAKKNKVLLNPEFSIVDLTRIKKINLKIKNFL